MSKPLLVAIANSDAGLDNSELVANEESYRLPDSRSRAGRTGQSIGSEHQVPQQEETNKTLKQFARIGQSHNVLKRMAR